jgi:hypothetical protein
LQEAALAMAAAAARGRSVVSVLKRLCPEVSRQIVRDGRYPGLLALWGRSVNVDEIVGQTIVHPAILRAIGSLAGVPMGGRAVHAGLEHTYGYLFSTIQTPYGFKRDRWLSPDVARGFGLELSLLSDRPQTGTLLANVTWFAGRIAFRDRPRLLARLQDNAEAVAPDLIQHTVDPQDVCRIVEEAVLPGKTGRVVSLVTDLVPFPQPPEGDGSNTLLIYSAQDGTRTGRRLITCFPVGPQFVRELCASVPAEGEVEVRPRYNAYIPGWPGKPVSGRRYFAPDAGG